ncbi:MAG TPA: 4,5-DOPA dioxygenase extradiol [Williamwhitmania sp.]|nr:4,5-DOPA dioxygenase extradiol [Williamwhitmania sp.]
MAITRMPAIFIGHGNPMNAIQDTPFSRRWEALATTLPKPRFILCISAHWETKGTKVTYSASPRTIHDFGGFPRELFEVEYPAPGSPALADKVIAQYLDQVVQPDLCWGLDHGCWSVLRKMYPEAGIPVVQLSIDYNLSLKEHFKLAGSLAALREKGVLIIGSGNIVHNLRLAQWGSDQVYGWARDFDGTVRQRIEERRFTELLEMDGIEGSSLAVPTPEHYIPLLYTLALYKDEEISLFNEGFDLSSISMTSLVLKG